MSQPKEQRPLYVELTLDRLLEAPQEAEALLSSARHALSALERPLKGFKGVGRELIAEALTSTTQAITELLERLTAPQDLPLSVALIGGTNTGKSATLNLLAQREVSRERVTANATKRPLLYAHERWREPLMSASRAWGALEPSVSPEEPLTLGQVPLLSLHQDEALGELILIDAPDLDSTAEANLTPAAEVARWADQVLFVLTPQKYKDTLIVSALKALLASGQPVVVLFNMVSERHLFEEMRQDLQRLLEVERLEARARFAPPLPVFKRAADEASREEARAQLLKLFNATAREEARRALLEKLLWRALRELDELLELLEVNATLGEALIAQLKEQLKAEARSLPLSPSLLAPRVERAHVLAYAETLTLGRLLSQAPQSDRPPLSPQEGAPLRALTSLLRALSGASLGALHALFARDAYARFARSNEPALSDDELLIGQLLSEHPALIGRLKERLKESLKGAPLDQTSTREGRVFEVAHEHLNGEAREAFKGREAINAHVREAFGERSTAHVAQLKALLTSALISALERPSLRDVESTLKALTKSHARAEPQGGHPQELSSHMRRAEVWLFKGGCALLCAALTLGFGPWDLLFGALGFEVGIYPVIWLTLRRALSSKQRSTRERALVQRRYELLKALSLSELKGRLSLEQRASLCSQAQRQELKALRAQLTTAKR